MVERSSVVEGFCGSQGMSAEVALGQEMRPLPKVVPMSATRVVMHQIVLPSEVDMLGICFGGQVQSGAKNMAVFSHHILSCLVQKPTMTSAYLSDCHAAPSLTTCYSVAKLKSLSSIGPFWPALHSLRNLHCIYP